jgi:hypothetical protein
MNTNSETHSDLIFSVHFDKTVGIAIVAVLIVALLAFIVLARRRQRQ